jgi:predicted component of type VI protein secretion system
LTAILTEQIRLFEPRLTAAPVRFVQDEANGPSKGAVSLNFVITAELVQGDNAVIRFNTVFDDRKFQVSS